MIELLRNMFEANPEKTTIVLTEKCCDCGCEINIEITPTSSGFGLQGGMLFKCNSDEYLAKCPACYESKPNTDENSDDTTPKTISPKKP